MTSTPLASAGRPALPAYGFLLLVGVTLFWGINWPGMKIVLDEMTVWWFRSISVGFGGFGLLLIGGLSTGTLRVPAKEIGQLLLCSLFAIVGWHLFTGYGVWLMPAGRASIIAFTMPVWASVLGVFLLGEQMTWPKAIGLMLGVAGLGVLIGPDLMDARQAPLGALSMLGAAVSWAIGTVLFKRFNWTAPVSILVGWQLALACIPLTIGALILEPLPDLTALSPRAIIALVYQLAIPMVFCQWAFFKVVRIFPAAIASLGTLAVPVVGVYSSALILGEPAGFREFLSLILICSALMCVMVLPAILGGRNGGSR